MTRKTAAAALTAVLALAATSRFSSAAAQGRFFDAAGSGEAVLSELKDLRRPQAGRAGGAAVSGAAVVAERFNGDLYYFSPEEAAQAAKAVSALEDSGETMGFKFDDDVPLEIQNQMRGDLAFIGSIQGSAGSGLHQKIFGAVSGSAYTQFFESRVKAIGMNDCGNGNAVACVIPFLGSSKMWLTNNFVRFSHPAVARMMIVFHEARHTEVRNGNWSHARCPNPFKDAQGNDMKSIWTGAKLAGQPACDVTPFGSYGSSMIMLKNIQKFCSNCTEKVRMDAGLYADDQFGRVTKAEARQQIQEDLYQ